MAFMIEVNRIGTSGNVDKAHHINVEWIVSITDNLSGGSIIHVGNAGAEQMTVKESRISLVAMINAAGKPLS